VKALLAAASFALPLVAGAAEHHVVIDGMKFTPQVVQVKKGDTIVWDGGRRQVG
jgi:plastocyanin